MALDLTRISALCFDVDGTIADTDDHIVNQVARVLHAVPLVSGRRAERWSRQVVMAAASPVNKAYHLLDRTHLDGPFHRLRDRLTEVRQRGADPAGTRNPEGGDEVPHEMMTGVQEMLKLLAGHYPMCTITTGREPRVERFLEHYGVRDCFTAVIGAHSTRRMKPHPEPLRLAAQHMGVAPYRCLMIGDTAVDIACGVAAGAQTVGVLCGFGTQRELQAEGADLILQTTSDLLAVLRPDLDPLKRSAAVRPAESAKSSELPERPDTPVQ